MKDTMLNTKEEWKTVPEFPNYKVSNFGRISNGKQILKQEPNNSGYLKVNFWKNKKPHSKTVHRQVALLFVDNPNGYSEVNHIDGNKLNNKYDNLEWCTRSANNKHALQNGLRLNPNPKLLTPIQEKELKFQYKNGSTQKELANFYNVHPDSLKKYLKGVYKQKPVSELVKSEIKRLYQTGLYTYKELSDLFDVGEGTIGRLIKNIELK